MPSFSCGQSVRLCKWWQRCLEIQLTWSTRDPCSRSLKGDDNQGRPLVTRSYSRRRITQWTSGQVRSSKRHRPSWNFKILNIRAGFGTIEFITHQINHNSNVVLLSDGFSKAFKLPRLVTGTSTTSLPSNIGLRLSLAICSNVAKALSLWPLVTWYLADSGNHGVIAANTNKGRADRPKSHLQPRVGATANAKATSKQAPRAQKHWNIEIKGDTRASEVKKGMHLRLIKRHTWHAVLWVEILRTGSPYCHTKSFRVYSFVTKIYLRLRHTSDRESD